MIRVLKATELTELAGLPHVQKEAAIRKRRVGLRPPVGPALLVLAVVALLHGDWAAAGGMLWFYWQTRLR